MLLFMYSDTPYIALIVPLQIKALGVKVGNIGWSGDVDLYNNF